ncbi:hypothetical protein D0864_17053 [Hortaea werneckii]|uniref:2',3'-cyclic-nucleotide 3'-phosphodiesterase n=1 Tax=Hortaea werneckii TaxID=91943 RepID=A0A3M7AK99_HORWE|nr:hypothetical protein KC352_g45896 [Hortaea werneckii]RMY27912.1 hypothetical protein D0864_17053 [Hortaea werneckii]
MPGSSLWLVPPEHSALYQTCHQLITTHIPSLFSSSLAPPPPPPPLFTPHVTLTADTVPSDLFPEPELQQSSSSSTTTTSSSTSPPDPTTSAQAWLDSIDLPPPSTTQEDLKVNIQKVQVEAHFFRKLTMRCEKSSRLCDLAGTCRAHHRGKEGLVGGEQKRKEVEEWVRESYAPHLSLM